MDYVALINNDLPNFPVDVVKQWLAPFAEKEGWPPKLDYNSNITGRWKYLLCKKPIDYWRKAEWKKADAIITPYNLESQAAWMVRDLVFANRNNEWNFYSMSMEDSKERFDSICLYMMESGKFPKPVIVEKINNKYKIVDGCHRMATFLYLSGYYKIQNKEIPCLRVTKEQEYWIAEQVS